MDSKATNPKDGIGVTKLPLHLVSPIVKAYQAVAHYLGAVKYGSWNYRAAGARASVYRAALDRHMDAWWEGEEFDPVDGTPHLANALACIGILIDSKHSGNLVDDRPPGRAQELRDLREQLELTMERIRQQYANRPEPKHYTATSGPAADAPPDRVPLWTEWDGLSTSPFAEGDAHQIEALLRDGTTRVGVSTAFSWISFGGPHDIVAYRIWG